jgi:hypothetical protein
VHYLAGLSTSANKTRIAGEVTRYDTDEENPQGNTQRLRGIRIKITGAGKEYEVTTGADGFYELYGAPAGKYVLEPVIPYGLVLMATLRYGPLDLSKIRSFYNRAKGKRVFRGGHYSYDGSNDPKSRIGEH